MSAVQRIGIFGASGQVGQSLLPMLATPAMRLWGFTRGHLPARGEQQDLTWCAFDSATVPALDAVVSTIPIWELPNYSDVIARTGARRLVALSSTSVFSKQDSPDVAERELAEKIRGGEDWLQSWTQERQIDWVILRPTMIYGHGRDHNISSLLRFIARFGCLPVLGRARGLRQPVHSDDVAAAVAAAVAVPAAANRAYNLSGGETLSYDALCRRLFAVLKRKPRLVRIPLPLFLLLRPAHRLLPHRLRWLVFMLERMNKDLIFDHGEAVRDLGFRPRPFTVTAAELDFKSDRILP